MSGQETDVGLEIKRALERAEAHELTSARRLRVRLYAHYGEGHHTSGLIVKARYSARDGVELRAQDDPIGVRCIPWSDLSAKAATLTEIVDQCVSEAAYAISLEPAQ